MKALELVPGNGYFYNGQVVRLTSIADSLTHGWAAYEATGNRVRLPLSSLLPLTGSEEATAPALPCDAIVQVSEAAWKKARRKFAILEPLLAESGNLALMQETAIAHRVSVATLYRWLRQYAQTGSVAGLLDRPNVGPGGQRRLPPAVEVLVRQALEEQYLTSQKKPVGHAITEARRLCRNAGLVPPSPMTIRRRLRELAPELVVARRQGPGAAQAQFEPIKGKFPGVNAPLDVVQLDHTLVDIILVDEQYRQPVGRPWLTIATDIFSRMVTGFYLSYETPGAAGTGMCLAHAILPKETWLDRLGVSGEWPCWGVMKALHTDNAKEFIGTMLQRACETYNIKPLRRIPGQPHLGGHIERLIGTFMQQVHTLPGTTFSNPRDRGRYQSEKQAAMTLAEFERWFATFVVNDYHRRVHSALGQSPFDRYREGLLGSPRYPQGSGMPPRPSDELQVRLDFMPAVERTVRRDGVVIGHIHYHADVLRPYITGAEAVPRKFIFKRDPRDISVIYFLDPLTKQYHPIPYRDTAQAAMSAWEYQEVRQKLREQGHAQVDEKLIMATHEDLRAQVQAAVAKTQGRRLNKHRHRAVQSGTATAHTFFFQASDTIHNTVHSPPAPAPVPDAAPPRPPRARSAAALQPFEGLDDDAFDHENG